MNLPVSKNHLFLSSIFLFICACSNTSSYRAPVTDIGNSSVASERTTMVLANGPSHRVNEGETLYAIAWMYDLDFNDLARVNNIQTPFVIFPGQELLLDISTSAVNTSSSASTTSANISNTRQASVSQNDVGNAQTRPSSVTNNLLRWVWPAQGEVLKKFSGGANENKGIDIAGNKGDSVFAAEAGEVVYSGNGLLRYGELIIIKHNDQFLSAYAHNDNIDVREGQRVTRAQKIASLGSTGVDQDMLHFEIRLAGKPVDPESYLPPK